MSIGRKRSSLTKGSIAYDSAFKGVLPYWEYKV